MLFGVLAVENVPAARPHPYIVRLLWQDAFWACRTVAMQTQAESTAVADIAALKIVVFLKFIIAP